jgi:hypothetical protein
LKVLRFQYDRAFHFQGPVIFLLLSRLPSRLPAVSARLDHGWDHFQTPVWLSDQNAFPRIS